MKIHSSNLSQTCNENIVSLIANMILFVIDKYLK